MPHLNSRGDVAHGVGGSYVNLNNQRRIPGAVLGWWDDDTVACFDAANLWSVSLYNMPTRTVTPLGGTGNHGFCSGQQSAAWFLATANQDRGVWTTFGYRAPDAGLLGMGPDDALALKPVYQSNGPTLVRRPDGTEWPLTPGTADTPRLLGEDRVLWMERGRPYTANLPPLTPMPGVQWFGLAAFVGGQWWYACYHETHGLILHPFTCLGGLGYSVLPQGDAWPTMRALSDRIVRVCWAHSEGEQAGDLHVRDYDVIDGMVRDPWSPSPGWQFQSMVDLATVNAVPSPPVTAAIALDTTAGSAPLTVTATLTQTGLTTWRWLLDGTIHQPIDGETHQFTLDTPGVHTIGLRSSPATAVPPQMVTVMAGVERPAFWRICSSMPVCDDEATGLAERRWQGVRVEGSNYDEVLAQCRRHGWRPLWTLHRHEEHAVPGGIDVEVGNECNAGCEGDPPWPKLTPAEYAAWVAEAWPTLLAKGCTVYVGAANNTSPSGIAWTREVLALLPFRPQLRVSFHRYPDGDQDVTKPKKGYRSLAEENAAIRACVDGRRWGISEAGLVDATYRDWSSWRMFGKKKTRLAVDGHRFQAERFKKLGAECYVVYQMHSGPGVGWPDEQGILCADLTTWRATADLPLL